MSKSIQCIVCKHEIAKWCPPTSPICPRCNTQNGKWLSIVCPTNKTIIQRFFTWLSSFWVAATGFFLSYLIAISAPIILTVIFGAEDLEIHFGALVLTTISTSIIVTTLITRGWRTELFKFREQIYSTSSKKNRWYSSPIIHVSLVLIIVISLGPPLLYYVIPFIEGLSLLNSNETEWGSFIYSYRETVGIQYTQQLKQKFTDVTAIAWVTIIGFSGVISLIMSAWNVDRYVERVDAEIKIDPLFRSVQKMKSVLAYELEKEGYCNVEWMHIERHGHDGFDWFGFHTDNAYTIHDTDEGHLKRKIITTTDLYCYIKKPVFILEPSSERNTMAGPHRSGEGRPVSHDSTLEQFREENTFSRRASTPDEWVLIWINHPNRRMLLVSLVNHFSLSELQSVCFVIGVHYERVPGDTIEDKARGLIEHCERRGRQMLVLLVEECVRLRPNIQWPEIR